MLRNNSTLTGFSQLGPHVGVRIHFPNISTPPFSLNIASNDPVRVIQPTNADSPAATIITSNSKPVGNSSVSSSMYFQDSERATKADAAPPKPLNKATISGIPVISTRTAMIQPINAPRSKPLPIKIQPSIPSPNSICRTVVRTATNIPMAPNWLPRGAVLGWDSLLRPKMNKTAENRYPRPIHWSSIIICHLFSFQQSYSTFDWLQRIHQLR